MRYCYERVDTPREWFERAGGRDARECAGANLGRAGARNAEGEGVANREGGRGKNGEREKRGEERGIFLVGEI